MTKEEKQALRDIVVFMKKQCNRIQTPIQNEMCFPILQYKIRRQFENEQRNETGAGGVVRTAARHMVKTQNTDKMKIITYYDRPTCVFGAVDTPNGRAIADEMLAWIAPEYNTHVIWHDGRMFEYHALRYAQELAMREDVPVLYLHTKGACNKPERSALIRKMWRREFGHGRAHYFAQAATERPLVLCPFTGPDRIHRYNGFVANAAAWRAIPLIQPNENRMVFEHLWRYAPEVEMMGTIYNDITSENLGKIHEYLRKNY